FPITFYVAAKSFATATQIPVAANADATGINVKLSPGIGAISGRVTNATTGAPMIGVGVSVFDASSNGFIRGFTTDGAGHYNPGLVLAPGQYKVTANLAGSATVAYNNKPSTATGDPITVTAGNATTGIDIAIPPLGSITGHVCANAPPPCGIPNPAISGAIVDVFDYGTNSFVANATTAGDRRHTLANPNPLP